MALRRNVEERAGIQQLKPTEAVVYVGGRIAHELDMSWTALARVAHIIKQPCCHGASNLSLRAGNTLPALRLLTWSSLCHSSTIFGWLQGASASKSSHTLKVSWVPSPCYLPGHAGLTCPKRIDMNPPCSFPLLAPMFSHGPKRSTCYFWISGFFRKGSLRAFAQRIRQRLKTPPKAHA